MFDFDVRDAHAPGDFAGSSHTLDRLRSDLAAAIETIPRRPPLIISPTSTAAEALHHFGDHEHGMALVASHGYLLGTLTEKQVLRHLRDQRESGLASVQVWRVMSVEPETLQESDCIGYALHKLRTLDLMAMPVLHVSGTLAGLLECRDLLAFVGLRTEGVKSDFVGHG